jgi:hypothetical protein
MRLSGNAESERSTDRLGVAGETLPHPSCIIVYVTNYYKGEIMELLNDFLLGLGALGFVAGIIVALFWDDFKDLME